MTAKDQLKLLNAGFTIIRKNETDLCIKYKSRDAPDWRILAKGFASRAALNRRMNEFLIDEKTVED